MVQHPRLVSFNSPLLRDWIQCSSRHVSRIFCRPARHSRWGAFPCVTIQQLGAAYRCLVNAFVYQSRRSFDHAGCHRPGTATCLRDLVETATVESQTSKSGVGALSSLSSGQNETGRVIVSRLYGFISSKQKSRPASPESKSPSLESNCGPSLARLLCPRRGSPLRLCPLPRGSRNLQFKCQNVSLWWMDGPLSCARNSTAQLGVSVSASIPMPTPAHLALPIVLSRGSLCLERPRNDVNFPAARLGSWLSTADDQGKTGSWKHCLGWNSSCSLTAPAFDHLVPESDLATLMCAVFQLLGPCSSWVGKLPSVDPRNIQDLAASASLGCPRPGPC